MTDIAAMQAEISRLETDISHTLDAATDAALASGDLESIHHRLMSCAASRPMQARLANLRYALAEAQADAEFGAGPSLATHKPTPPMRTAPPTPPASLRPADTRTREDKIRTIATGFPVPIPADMVAKAISDGHAVDAFAIAAADFSAKRRLHLAREAEINALVADIVGFVPTATNTPVAAPVADDRTVDQMVDDIVDTIPLRDRRT